MSAEIEELEANAIKVARHWTLVKFIERVLDLEVAMGPCFGNSNGYKDVENSFD